MLLQLVTALSHAALPVVIEQGKGCYPLGGHIELLEDKQGKWTINDIVKQHTAGRFKKSKRDVPNLGYTDATFWLQFTIQTNLPKPGDMLLEFDWPHTDLIELFVFVKDTRGNFILTHNKLTGRKVPMADWEIRHRNFLFNLPPEGRENQYVFIKLKTDDSLRAPLILWKKQAFWQHAKNEYCLMGAFYGLMFVIIFYNLLVYLTTKDLSFLLFILHIAPTALFELSFNGLGYEYLWPFFPQFNIKAMPIFVFLLIGFAAIFSKQFLSLKAYIPLSDRLMNIIIALSAIGLLILFVVPAPLANIYTASLAGIYPVVLLFISFQSLRHRIPYSKHFIFIWALVLVSTSIAGLTFLGVLPHGKFTNYFHQCCSALEASLFSIVLAGRINALREKNKKIALIGKQAEQKREAAVASSKAKSAFLANMSHEIRTPINAITGILYLLKETELTPVQQDFTEKMRTSASALLGIINDILDISKIEAGKLKLEQIDFELNTVIENVTTLVEMTTARKNLDLIVSYDNITCMHLHGDPLRLGQVLTNLINNAVKFTNRGEAGIYCKKIGENRFRFDVTDTGIGLTDEEIGRLFLSFSQADKSTTRKYGGTGLGLAISKHLVEMMDGRIWVKSMSGRGSVFSFEVTLFEQPENTESSVESETFDDKTALIIDGSASWRRILQKMLGRYHIRTQAISDGKKAVDMITREKFDLVFVDRNIQAMGWKETITAINRQPGSGTGIIVMTQAYHQKRMMQEAEKEKIAAFLLKPVSPFYLHNIIHKIFTGETIEQTPPQSSINIASLRKEIKTLKGSQILLVDDIKLNREIICGILTGSGIMIDEAENGQIALEMVRNAPEQYELIFMDIQMPVMDGYEATKQIRRINQHIPIIALTASAMESDVRQAMEIGATRHLRKPVEVDQLFLTLLKFVSKKCEPCNISDTSSGQPEASVENVKASLEEGLQALTQLDVPLGLRHTNGDKTLFIKLLCNFAGEYQGVTTKLRETIDKDKNQAERIAHTIKGLAANIGAARLHKLAEQIEMTLDQTLLPAFDEALNDVIGEIRASSIFQAQPDRVTLKKITTQKCNELWEQLSEAVETRRPHLIQPVLAVLEEAALEPDDAKLFENVKTALKKYRFHQALDAIKQKK